MPDSPLSREMALRVGLAARALPDVTPGRMLRLVERMVGLPPSERDIQALRPKDLRTALGDDAAEATKADIEAALNLLKGLGGAEDPLIPRPVAIAEGDMPGSIRVACASNTGEAMDGHFGSCARFLIYQVSADETRLIDVRAAEVPAGAEDRNAARADIIADCQVLFVVSIGGPPAAKVVRRDIHPVKHPSGGPARDLAAGLGDVLAKGAPPWLAKAMGRAPEDRVRLAAGGDA